MPSTLSPLLSVLLSLSLLPLLHSLTTTPQPLTAHTQLQTHGFPIGLLPTPILSYTLNTTTGDFAVNLGSTCKLTLPPDNYLATYSKVVKGKLVNGRISDLEGIRVRAMFKWWSITGIKSDGKDLTFEVGIVTAKYPSKNFDLSPPCEGRRADH